MEQVPYWMWTKRKPNMMSSLHQAAPASTKIPISYNDSSWEEQAFAEDATGAFGGGGCIWPPRSYSCSFCRREFRSAQALGGHMNVHRRDRARLKQSSPTHHQDHHQNHHLGFQYLPSHDPVCHLVYQNLHQNPNSNEGTNNILSRVSGFSVVDDDNNYDQQIITNNLDPPNTMSPISSSPPSWANFVVGRYNHSTLDLKKSDKPKADRSLNLVLHATNTSDAEEEEATRSCKKRRIIISSTDASTLPFKIIQEHHVSAVEFLDEQSSNGTILEDLDLELRLGDRPKVK